MTEVFSMGSLNVNGARETKKRALIHETFKTKQIYVPLMCKIMPTGFSDHPLIV